MGKLWKKFYHVAHVLSKENSQHYLSVAYYDIVQNLNELKNETHKTVQKIQSNLLSSRSMILGYDQLEDYMKHIELANEIIHQKM